MPIFNFIKRRIQKTFSIENITIMFDIMKNKIIEQAKYELAGSDKKNNVDKAVISFIQTNMKSANPLVSALINILIDYVPILTQYVYEYLKKYVDGLTEA